MLGTSIQKAGRGAHEPGRLAKTNRWTAMNGGRGNLPLGQESPETQVSSHWSVIGHHRVMAQVEKKEPEIVEPQATNPFR